MFTESWSRDQLMQKAYYHLINVNITLLSCSPVRSWEVVTPLEKMKMGFQFNLALHVYLILDCLDQGLNNFKQKYHVR